MTTLALFARYKEILDKYNEVTNPAKSDRPKSKFSFLSYIGHGKTGRARSSQFQIDILDTSNEKNDLEFLRDVFNFAYNGKKSSQLVQSLLAQVEKDVGTDLPRVTVQDFKPVGAWGGTGVRTTRLEYNNEYHARLHFHLNSASLQMKAINHP
jgi:hypothetical protein